jgi:hypothetical protein
MEDVAVKRNSVMRFCPFIQRPPVNDCYCIDEMESLFVEGTIYYCLNNYLECEIYKSLSAKLKKKMN